MPALAVLAVGVALGAALLWRVLAGARRAVRPGATGVPLGAPLQLRDLRSDAGPRRSRRGRGAGCGALVASPRRGSPGGATGRDGCSTRRTAANTRPRRQARRVFPPDSRAR